MNKILTKIGYLILGVAVVFISPAVAFADAIDGDWCLKAKKLNIDGPKIVTPGGKTLAGDYDRHGFRYVAPAGERSAGKKIILNVLDDENMERRVGNSGKAEMWRRCPAPIS